MQTSQRIVSVCAGLNREPNLGRDEWGEETHVENQDFKPAPTSLHSPQTLPSDQRNWLEFFSAFMQFINHPVKYSLVSRLASGPVLGFALKLHTNFTMKSKWKEMVVFPLVYLAFTKSLIYLFNTQLLTSLPEAISSMSDPSLFATQSQHHLHEL